MHTRDFSKAPKPSQAEYAFFGGTRYKGVLALVQLGFVWFRLSRAMRRAPGYMGHYIWYRFPFTFGNFSLWDSWQSMMRFARSKEHRRAMAFVARPRIGKAAFVRFLRFAPDGHTLGTWRVEPDAADWRDFKLPFSSGEILDMKGWTAPSPTQTGNEQEGSK